LSFKEVANHFKSILNLSDLSRDSLLKLANLYSKLYIALDGFWYVAVMERMGNDKALECDLTAWQYRVADEVEKLTGLLNIVGNGVSDVMKFFQVALWFQQMKYEIQLRHAKDAILTITHCPTLEALENEGQNRHIHICNVVDRQGFQRISNFFNPTINVECLTPLPRKHPSDTPCKWRFWLD